MIILNLFGIANMAQMIVKSSTLLSLYSHTEVLGLHLSHATIPLVFSIFLQYNAFLKILKQVQNDLGNSKAKQL